MTDPASPFQLIDSAPLAPGGDLFTGKLDGPFIDTGYTMAFAQTGRVYISVDVLREMASQAGLIDIAVSEEPDLTQELAYSKGLMEGLTQNASLVDATDQLARTVRDLQWAHGARSEGTVEESQGGADEDGVLVTTDRGAGERGDNAGAPVERQGGAGKPAARRKSGGQGNGARRNSRPDVVPGSAGNDADSPRL